MKWDITSVQRIQTKHGWWTDALLVFVNYKDTYTGCQQGGCSMSLVRYSYDAANNNFRLQLTYFMPSKKKKIPSVYATCFSHFHYPYLLTYLFTYLLTPRCSVLLEQLTGLQLVNKFPPFHGTRRFITALKSVRHLSLYWASPIQSIYPQSTSWRSILILFAHLRLGLPSGLFPSGFPTKTLYTPLSSPIRATCPAHLIPLGFITRTILGEEYKSFISSLCNLLHLALHYIICS